MRDATSVLSFPSEGLNLEAKHHQEHLPLTFDLYYQDFCTVDSCSCVKFLTLSFYIRETFIVYTVPTEKTNDQYQRTYTFEFCFNFTKKSLRPREKNSKANQVIKTRGQRNY